MPRTQNISVQKNFVKGLITEATAFTFPENACTEADNCLFDPKGLVSRRLGFDFETGYNLFEKAIGGDVLVTYLWKNVSGDAGLNYVVTQVGNILHFYKVSADGSLSSGRNTDTVNLLSQTTLTDVGQEECQFSSGNGLLFVTHPHTNSFYVEYDATTDTFTSFTINIRIRDFEGDITDTIEDTRPTSTLAGLSASHRYNLLNQGWKEDRLVEWDTARTDMPSNADVMWRFKNSTNEFDVTTVDDRFDGSSEASKGHFIFNVYDIERSSKFAGATDLLIEEARVATSVFFAGRVFYAGLKYSKHGSRIYFSQIIEDKSQYGKAYQVNDPTSESLFALLPSDGGMIDLIEAGTVLKMTPFFNTLIVVATNGVWGISGSQGTGFTANDYGISKLSSITNISHTSFVDVEGVPYWWNYDGIYTVTADPQSNALRVINITDNTIKTFFDAIPVNSKMFVRGIYDPEERRIIWLYREKVINSFSDKYIYDRILSYNLLTQAFVPWSTSTAQVRLSGVVCIIGAGGTFTKFNVVHGVDQVVHSGDTVVAFIAQEGSSVSSKIKYLVSAPIVGVNNITFAETYRDSYLDWETHASLEDVDPFEYDSYFVTGYAIKGDGLRKFQYNYVNIFSQPDVDCSFKIRGQWNFATNGNSGRWSTSQVFSQPAGDFSVRTNKPKIRGSGLACQLRIENNGADPFKIIGWSVFESANRWP